MSSKKKLFISIAFLLVLALILIFWFSKKNTSSSSATQTTSVNGLPIIHGEKPAISINTFDITTRDGIITINNIYKLPGVILLDFDGVNFKNSQYYHMEYYPKQQGFIIAILDPAIQKAREIAESDFLEVLNITQDQACKLNISLTVPPSVNGRASGGNYGLSFCPNGKAFPK
ncbi:MAG: hypothetical protein NTY33_02475 [Candidatus Moranbacteria bacterium]|nr:hypothetical protein [Candidatus Moranbacteria bacterium]